MASSAFPKRCEKPCLKVKAVVGHGGPASPSTAVFAGPRSTAFREHLDQALAREDLGEVYGVWNRWAFTGFGGYPLDSREFAAVRRRAAGIARRALRNAVRGEETGSLEQALKAADLVESRWPHAVGVKSSLEYQAAKRRQQEQLELEEKDVQAESQQQQLEKVLSAASPDADQQSTEAGSEPGEDAVEEERSDKDERSAGMEQREVASADELSTSAKVEPTSALNAEEKKEEKEEVRVPGEETSDSDGSDIF